MNKNNQLTIIFLTLFCVPCFTGNSGDLYILEYTKCSSFPELEQQFFQSGTYLQTNINRKLHKYRCEYTVFPPV